MLRHAAFVPMMMLALTASAAPAAAQAPPGLGDLVGARGSSGETQMEARGYTFIKTVTAREQKWSYWWGQSQGQCVQVATADGRYAAITTVPSQNCGASSAGGDPPDLGAPRPPSLTLICYGEGRKPSVESRRGYEWDPKERRFQPSYHVQSTTQGFAPRCRSRSTATAATSTSPASWWRRSTPPASMAGGN